MSKKPLLRVLELRRPGPVLVCRKCLKRMANGGKLRRRLKASLKQRSAGQKKRRARLVLRIASGSAPRMPSLPPARQHLRAVSFCWSGTVRKNRSRK